MKLLAVCGFQCSVGNVKGAGCGLSRAKKQRKEERENKEKPYLRGPYHVALGSSAYPFAVVLNATLMFE
jgi:hypothetical protein